MITKNDDDNNKWLVFTRNGSLTQIKSFYRFSSNVGERGIGGVKSFAISRLYIDRG